MLTSMSKISVTERLILLYSIGIVLITVLYYKQESIIKAYIFCNCILLTLFINYIFTANTIISEIVQKERQADVNSKK